MFNLSVNGLLIGGKDGQDVSKESLTYQISREMNLKFVHEKEFG